MEIQIHTIRPNSLSTHDTQATLWLVFFSCSATRDGPKNLSHLNHQQVEERWEGRRRTRPGAGMGHGRARGLLAPPRTTWDSGTGCRRSEAGPSRKAGEGPRSRG